MHRLTALAILEMGVLVWCIGCETRTAADKTAPDAAGEHAGHDHELEGPHGGHLIKLAGDQYQAEWTHDDKIGKVTVYLLDKAGKEDAAINSDRVVITTRIEGGEENEYLLPAERGEDDSGKASTFSLTEPELVTALKVGKGVVAKLRVDVDGQLLEAEIEHHEHGGHHH